MTAPDSSRFKITGGRNAVHMVQVAAIFLMCVSFARAEPPMNRGSLTDPSSPQEIDRLVKELGHASYDVRVFATRRLLAIGMPARARLLEAEQSDMPEVVLRAKKLLLAFRNLLFHGIRVELSFSKTRIVWDEPIDLQVTLINDSEFDAQVLLETDETERAKLPPESRQVADMLDVAESLRVFGPTERTVGLRVDDINLDPHVAEVVQARLGSGPIGTIAAGERVTVVVRDFNRGWARMPLLDAGQYAVQFDYMPRWEDQALVDAQVGRVLSNEASITVTKAAPETVSRRGVEASLTVERKGRDLVASLVNRTDKPLLINRNFGTASPFSHGRWVYDRDGNMREISSIMRPNASWKDFKAELLVPVAPGATLELTRIAQAELVKGLAAQGAHVDETRWELYFTYTNLCDRNWQKRQGSALLGAASAPEFLRELLPRNILSGWYTSNRISVSRSD